MAGAGQNRARRAMVVVAATGKGGAGKTTTVACLAAYWTKMGRRVSLVDADPNQTLARWHSRGDVLKDLPLIAEHDPEQLLPAIESLAGDGDVVAVDCAGFTSQAMLFAIGTADLVLVPTMTDEANIFEAARTMRLVGNAATLTRRDIPARVVLCRVKRSAVANHARDQLARLGLPVLGAHFSDRVAFQEASFFGTAPSVLQPSGAASRDIAEVGGELDDLLWSAAKRRKGN